MNRLRAIRTVLVLLLPVLISACVHSGVGSDDPDEDRYSRFEAAYDDLLHLPDQAQGAALAPLYEELFGANIARMNRAPTSALRQLTVAAAVMGGVSGHPTYPDHHLRAFRTLEQRGVIETMDVNVLYRHLVSTRYFVAARALFEQYPNASLPPIPAIVPLTQRPAATQLVYRVDDESALLHEHAVTVHKGTHVVAVISPGCPFSRRAITDIEQDPRLRELVGDHTLWLGDPRSMLHFADYQQWHRDHPGSRMVIAAIRGEWSFLHSWAFPSFFVLRDGLVVGSLRGWPPDGSHRDALVALLELAVPESDPQPH